MCDTKHRCQKQRTCRAGRRKQKQIHTIVGHRPLHFKPARPPATLTQIASYSDIHNNTQPSNAQNINNHLLDLSSYTAEQTTHIDSCNTDIHDTTPFDQTENLEGVSMPILSLVGHRPIRSKHTPRLPSVIVPITQVNNNTQTAEELNDNLIKNYATSNTIDSDQHSVDKSKLDFILFNARSVRNKAIAIADYISDKRPDIFAITESWLCDSGDGSILSHLIPPGYDYILQNRPSSNRGGGIIVIFKNHLNITKVISETKSSFEYIEFLLRQDNQMFRFVIVYRPDQTKKQIYFNNFIDDFEDLLLEKITQSGKLLLLGDFNIHVDDTGDRNASKFLNLINNFNLTQHVKEPTHVAGHTLDLVITQTNDPLISSLSVLNPQLSDHHTISFKLPIQKPKPTKKKIKYRKTNNINLNDFKLSIIEANIAEKIKSLDDVNDQVNIFNTELENILNIHAPLKTGTFNVRPNNEWHNDTIRNHKRKLRQAERKFLKTKSDTDKKIFINLRKKMNKILTNTKRRFIKTKIFENKRNTKELFKITSKLLKPPVSDYHDNPPILCEEFNKFFVHKIKKIREELCKIDQTAELETSHSQSSLSDMQPATIEEIENIIKTLSSKTCSLDPIPTWLLKECADILTPSITTIVNTSISSGCFPSSLKHALVTPILKKQSLDRSDYKNFRPVSNIASLSKIIEKVINIRLSKYLDENDIQPHFQSAFKSNHSTETALLRVQNDILRMVDNKSCVMLILLDLSAAFDTIDHEILLSRLRNYFGVSGVALEWFASYIKQRTQSVMINSCVSSHTTLDYGVPQGSILGPILFTLYTAPLAKIIGRHDLGYHLYADDTQLYLPLHRNTDTLPIKKIQDCTADIHTWMTANKLKLNGDKTDIIILGNNKMLKVFDNVNYNHVNICDSDVKISNTVKNLGVIFNSSLSMEYHVSNIVQSTIFQLKNISKIRNYVDSDTAKLLIISFVISRLDYCNSMLWGISQKQTHRLQKIQNYAARIITFKRKNDSITNTLKELHWLPIKQRLDFKILCITYKCLNGLAPVYLNELLTPVCRSRTLRSNFKNDLIVPRTSTTLGDRAFSVCGPRLWNKLDNECKMSPSFDIFKKNLKHHVFKQCYDS